jgi:hypothetical protein
MPENDSELRFAEMERDNLQSTISAVETALAASTPGTREPLENFLRNASGRVLVLEKKIKDTKLEEENHAREQLALFDLAARETALSTKEKETYNGFLKEEFFTKRDFTKLSEFYAHTWDRLSEGGKDQMSHRVWEGIRRDLYKFSDLPQVVQEKEEDRAYAVLKKREAQSGAPDRIPAVDRDDFIREYEGGKRKDAAVILSRPSFREHMFLGKDSAPIRSREAEVGAEAQAARMRDHSAASPAATDSEAQPLPPSRAKANVDASGLKLEGMALAALPPDVSTAGLPNAGSPKSRDAELLRGG